MSIVRVILPEGGRSYQEFRDLPRKGDVVVITNSESGDVMFVVKLVMHYSADAARRKDQCPDVYVRRPAPEELKR